MIKFEWKIQKKSFFELNNSTTIYEHLNINGC